MNQTSQHLQDINQDFKEKEIEKKALDLGVPYINLLNFKVNPDTLSLVSKEQSELASLVVFFQIGKKIRIAVSDMNNIHAKRILDQFKVEHFSLNINLASPESIQAIQKLYESSLYQQNQTVKKENIEIKDEEEIATEALQNFEKNTEKSMPQKKSNDALSEIHSLAIKLHASDVHFQVEKDIVQLRFRIDGMLQNIMQIDKKTYEGLSKQIKFNSQLKLNITKLPQDGQYIFSVNNRDVDMRVSTLPNVYGESIVLRVLDSKKGILPLNELGYKKYSLESVADSLSKAEGMILLTGPTGSGKTSTLYSMLDVLNRPHRKIVSLEDPVEYSIPGILQCEVSREEKGERMSFQDGLTAILRQDPDVIMLGEIREPEVAATALQAAITGHLVLSTLHANSSIEAIQRLLYLKIPSYLLSAALNTVIAQRLVRKICSNCKTSQKRSDKDIAYLEKNLQRFKDLNITIPKLDTKEWFGKGCEKCNNTGFSGRLTLVEILKVSTAIKKLIQEESSVQEILLQAEKESFISMKEDACVKVAEGETTLKEIWRVLG